MQPKWLISHLIFFLVHVKSSSAEEPGYPQMSPLAQRASPQSGLGGTAQQGVGRGLLDR